MLTKYTSAIATKNVDRKKKRARQSNEPIHKPRAKEKKEYFWLRTTALYPLAYTFILRLLFAFSFYLYFE